MRRTLAIVIESELQKIKYIKTQQQFLIAIC